MMMIPFTLILDNDKTIYLNRDKISAVSPRLAGTVEQEFDGAYIFLHDEETPWEVSESAEEVISRLRPAIYTVQTPLDLQARVQPWILECFGEGIANDKIERNHRFLEEALELVQSCACTQQEAHELVDYVFNRKIGDKAQEVGGVMITLAALCLANDLDMRMAGEHELYRIEQPEIMDRIREKQANKPKHSPLPE